MSAFYKIDIIDKDLLASLQGFFKNLLSADQMDALLMPWHLPMDNHVMPTLITDPENLEDADPLAPCFPLNSARIASRLTKKRSGQTVGLVMRPCEQRAFTELFKLKQGALDDVVMISLDCLGAYTNTDYSALSKEDPKGFTRQFYENILDKKEASFNGLDLAGACKICEHPVSKITDINIGLYALDYKSSISVEAVTQKGAIVLEALGLEPVEEPSARAEFIDSLIAERIALRDEVFRQTSESTSNISKLSRYFAACVNCYNCRVACPVCYCRECVFVTDVFDHDPYQYLKWAQKKGKIKMPTDTNFFHLTRMAHIALTCVGCGQCSNACPNDIPLAELFRTVAHNVQEDFDYEAGRSFDEPIPFSVFNDKEYEDVVGTAAGSG